MLLRVGKIGEGVGRLMERELAGTYNGTKWDEDAHRRCGLSILNTGARDVPRMFKDPRFCLDDGGYPCDGQPKTDGGGTFLDTAERCIIFWGEKRKKREETRREVVALY